MVMAESKESPRPEAVVGLVVVNEDMKKPSEFSRMHLRSGADH